MQRALCFFRRIDLMVFVPGSHCTSSWRSVPADRLSSFFITNLHQVGYTLGKQCQIWCPSLQDFGGKFICRLHREGALAVIMMPSWPSPTSVVLLESQYHERTSDSPSVCMNHQLFHKDQSQLASIYLPRDSVRANNPHQEIHDGATNQFKNENKTQPFQHIPCSRQVIRHHHT